MWGNWGTEESGIICWSHSACFLYIQPIAFKLVFTCPAWFNLEMTEEVWVCSFLLPLPSPHLEEIAWIIQIICLLYLPVTSYLCLWDWGVYLPTGLHGTISWGRAELQTWGSKQVYDITGPMSWPWWFAHELQALGCGPGGSPVWELVLAAGEAACLEHKLQARMGLRKRSEPSNCA